VDPAQPNTLIDQWANLKLAGKAFAPPTTAAALNALNAQQQQVLSTLISRWNCSNKALDAPTKPLITCDVNHTQKYLLGPVIVKGTELKSAAAQAPGSTPGQVQWTVTLSLKSTGAQQWAKYTSQHNEQVKPGDVENLVAYTLDGEVLEAATVQSTINGDTQITGSFTAKQAQNLANSLKYGALPLSFTPLTNGSISPTLGTSQLKAGLLAGGIGLALVVIYSMIYYRALGLVTIASLIVSGGLTYAMLVVLGHQIGFTLTLAGIAGFIVAVGITADSFVVFFERIKDEVHEGRSARVAVPRAWERARRTIISADTVSLLAAVTLYYFAAGDVKGFAFTLGLSTLLDLVVVFLFTHPLVSLFSRSAAFGSARFTGLNAIRSGGIAPAFAGIDEGVLPGSAKVSRRARRLSETHLSTDADVPAETEPSGQSERPDATELPDERERPAEVSTEAIPAMTAAERAAARRGLRRDTGDESGEDTRS
jgi:preprotein translocase subunit SecD